MRRPYGFSAQEVANLRSWGVEVRPEEIAPPVSQRVGALQNMVPAGARHLGISELEWAAAVTGNEKARLLMRKAGIGW